MERSYGYLTVYHGVVCAFLMCMASVFHFEFSIASALHECEQTQNRTVVVELGDRVSRIFHVISFNITKYLSGDVFHICEKWRSCQPMCCVSIS